MAYNNQHTFWSRIERHDVMNQNWGQIEKEEIGDGLVSIDLFFQIFPELEIRHVLVHQHAQHRLNLFKQIGLRGGAVV